MAKLWNWLSDARNLALLTAIGGALGFLWVQVINPILHPVAQTPAVVAPAVPSITQTAVSDGGVAVNNVGGSTEIGDSAATEPAVGAASAPATSSARNTKNGGVAVNDNASALANKPGSNSENNDPAKVDTSAIPIDINQKANAKNGGTAINNNSGRVVIKRAGKTP